MTEIDVLKYELEESRNAFDTLHKKYIELLKQQGRLEKENKELKETLAFRSNQLALMERLVDDLGSEEMERQMEEILND